MAIELEMKERGAQPPAVRLNYQVKPSSSFSNFSSTRCFDLCRVDS